MVIQSYPGRWIMRDSCLTVLYMHPPKKPPLGIQHSCLATVSTPRTATRTAAVFSDAVGGRPELGASHGLGEAREVMKMADGNKDVRVSGHTTRPS